jgi:hypothetical protein
LPFSWAQAAPDNPRTIATVASTCLMSILPKPPIPLETR